MRKAVSLLVLVVVSLVPAGLVTAAASPTSPVAVAPAARVAFAPLAAPPAAVDLPAAPSSNHLAPAKRKASAPTKHRGVYHCEMHPLQMGTVDTEVQVCDWR